MGRTMLTAGALAGFVAVALGAFGAHGLEGRLPAAQLAWWDKAVDYHALHALALLAVGLLARRAPSRAAAAAGWAFAVGILLFSGSLYLLALTGARWLGAVTPFGGTAFLIGWGALAVAARRLPGAP
ncbi:MAG: DUF423 domain-containing protein [Gammaproteobacteria bacterium]